MQESELLEFFAKQLDFYLLSNSGAEEMLEKNLE
jgi:hypothetical protein